MCKSNHYTINVYAALIGETWKQQAAIDQQCGKFKIAVKRTRKVVKARNSKLVKYWLIAGGALATFSVKK
jgi:hypothetical protein